MTMWQREQQNIEMSSACMYADRVGNGISICQFWPEQRACVCSCLLWEAVMSAACLRSPRYVVPFFADEREIVGCFNLRSNV